MTGENGLLFDMGTLKSEETQREKLASGLEMALQRLDSMEKRVLKNLENRASRGEKFSAADYRAMQDLRQRLEGRRQESLPDHVVRTAKEVAERFGRTVRTIRNWSGRGMPQLPEGYDLLAIQEWGIKEGVIKERVIADGTKTRIRDDNGNDNASQDRAHFELRIKELDSQLKEIKLQKETGILINRHEVEKEWESRAFEFKRDLMSMARRLSLRCANKTAPELFDLIRLDCVEVLKKYARDRVDVDRIEGSENGDVDR